MYSLVCVDQTECNETYFFVFCRIQLCVAPQRVDPVIPDMELIRFDAEVDVGPECELSYSSLSVSGEMFDISRLDKASGVLRVWVLLLEGLCTATLSCCRQFQPHILDTLCTLFREILVHPGKYAILFSRLNPDFSVFFSDMDVYLVNLRMHFVPVTHQLFID